MKVLRIISTSFDSLGDIKWYIQEYTINNGGYPDQIDMDKEALDKYISLLFDFKYDRKNMRVYGVKIVEKL